MPDKNGTDITVILCVYESYADEAWGSFSWLLAGIRSGSRYNAIGDLSLNPSSKLLFDITSILARGWFTFWACTYCVRVLVGGLQTKSQEAQGALLKGRGAGHLFKGSCAWQSRLDTVFCDRRQVGEQCLEAVDPMTGAGAFACRFG